MFFNEDHLQITAIRTNNGTTPVFDEQGRPVKKIVFAPKNRDTIRLFEDQNRRLPTHLKMKIDVVRAYKPEPVQTVVDTTEIDDLRLKNLELEKRINDLIESQTKAKEADKIPEPNGNGAIAEAKPSQHEKK